MNVKTWFGVVAVSLIYWSIGDSESQLAGQEDKTAITPTSSWSQFLGPNRNGVSTATNLLDQPPKDGLKTLWRVDGGIGMSAVVVDQQDAVTVARRSGKQTVLCLDAETGKEKWAYPLATAYNNAMGNGTRATPTLTNNAVIAFSGEGILASIDRKSGSENWKVNVVEELGGEIAEYGMASSPLVVGNKIYVIAGAPDALVAAYDLKTGKILWKSGNAVAGYSSPTLLTLMGEPMILAFGGDGLYAFDPENGKQLWRYEFETNYNCNIVVPIKVDEDLFLSAGEDHGSVRLKIRRDDDQYKLAEVWSAIGKSSPFRNEWQTSVLIGDCLYGMDNVGGAGPITHLVCVDAGTGEMVWRETRYGKGNFTLADGKLFLATIDGELVIAKVDRKGYHELGRQKVLGMTRQSPTICNGKLYLRDDKEIVCLDVSK